MKEIFQQYVIYNKWANDRMIEAITALPPTLIDQPVESSFKSLRLTVLHLWETESAWWQRVHLTENVVSPAKDPRLPFDLVISEWKQQSLQWQDWVMNANDINLTHVIAYMNSKKEQFKQPVFQILLHLFNHGSYHRGQLVTMLRQFGIQKIPNTDFINWSRNNK